MKDLLLVVEMIAYMEKNLKEVLNTDELSLKSGYSVNRFRQKFFNVTGDTPSGYLRKRKLTEAAEERENVEKELREHLNRGNLCALGFLESQLFSGYDEEGFLFLSPWGEDCVESVVPRLTYGNWKECLDREGWVHFTVFAPNEKRIDILKAIRKSWEYGLELYRKPETHSCEGYGINHEALKNWINAVEKGLGNSHGNWWNGEVWSEGRGFMASYFDEIKGLFDSEEIDNQCDQLSVLYRKTSKLLKGISDKELEKEKKLSDLKELQKIESQLEAGLEKLLTFV